MAIVRSNQLRLLRQQRRIGRPMVFLQEFIVGRLPELMFAVLGLLLSEGVAGLLPGLILGLLGLQLLQGGQDTVEAEDMDTCIMLTIGTKAMVAQEGDEVTGTTEEVGGEWAPERLDDHSFQVEFPRREDLQRLLTFGVSRVSGSKCMLEFEECKKPEPQGTRLQNVWIRFSGIPETLLNDFLIVWSLGSLIGKTEKVDMPFTRKRGIARLLVMVLDVEYIPDFAPWSYDGVHYDLDVEVEVDIPTKSNDGDVHMTDGDERDKDHGDTDKEKSSDRSKDGVHPSSSSAKDKSPFNEVTPSSSSAHMDTLRLGSFEIMHDMGRLGGAAQLNLGAQHKIKTTTVTSNHACMMAQEMPHDIHGTVASNASVHVPNNDQVQYACMLQDMHGDNA
ncbi:hypothetical protein D1007_57850 [Hordeum vulgare]|nr:hypothetical protein D1007_57850 [Hordeum vulgare]